MGLNKDEGTIRTIDITPADNGCMIEVFRSSLMNEKTVHTEFHFVIDRVADVLLEGSEAGRAADLLRNAIAVLSRRVQVLESLEHEREIDREVGAGAK